MIYQGATAENAIDGYLVCDIENKEYNSIQYEVCRSAVGIQCHKCTERWHNTCSNYEGRRKLLIYIIYNYLITELRLWFSIVNLPRNDTHLARCIDHFWILSLRT